MIEREPRDPDDESLLLTLTRTLNRETNLRWGGGAAPSRAPETLQMYGFREDENGRWVLAGMLLIDSAITAEMLRAVPVAAVENDRNDQFAESAREELAKLTPLQDADRSDPEAFSQLVAAHYKLWARAVPYPVANIAAAAGVKAPTVHTWVREARLRGLLPPARRGKAG
ncbi:hypothetical protein ACQPZX_42740 [Actinoplanes sp. CA-142083]|uniref:hypothetical protein n=1 Tax=Actinoplanes sp. CA-142083 TaxID=3239903 RepID=UPI003D9270C3